MSIHILFGDFFVETDELNGQTDRQTERQTFLGKHCIRF